MIKNRLYFLNLFSGLIHSTYSKSYNIIYDQFNEAVKIPQKWIEDIRHVEFNELLASSIGPLALFFNWKKKQKEEFYELASGVLSSSFIHGDPIGSITAIVVLAYKYNQSSNNQELRNLKWGIIKGSLSIGTFALTIKSMGLSLLSFLVGLCVVAIVRKTVSNLRFFEYIKFLKSLKTKIPYLKRKISRREFISFKIFELKKA